MNKNILIVIVAVLVLGGIGAFVMMSGGSEDSNSDESTSETYSMDDVSMHNIEEDCWMVLDGVVYDVTEYVSDHPGGDEIVRGCGVDATQMFQEIEGGRGHSNKADTIADEYMIGTLE